VSTALDQQFWTWLFGACLSLGSLLGGLCGYFVRRLSGEITSVARDLDTEITRQNELRHALRNETNAALLNVEMRGKEAVSGLEARTNVMIQRLIDLINSQHAETKADLRVVQEDLRKLVFKSE